MRRAVIVFVGGGIGSCLRAVALAWLSAWSAWLPVLLVNLVGSFVIGVVFALVYVVASVVGGVAAAGAGVVAGREIVVALERAAVGLLGRLEERGLRRTGTSRRASEARTRQDREE